MAEAVKYDWEEIRMVHCWLKEDIPQNFRIDSHL
jgi:hypothetical protein